MGEWVRMMLWGQSNKLIQTDHLEKEFSYMSLQYYIYPSNIAYQVLL